jgi:histidyl-tRNA synthetase
VRLRLSSLGTPATRRAYSDELREHLRAHASKLSEDVRERLDANPLRAFDSDHPGTVAALEDAPRLLDRIDQADAEHLAEVRALLDGAGLRYELDGTLVRGLDYYTRTVFEFTSDQLGAQSGVAGGGRYDGLVEQLGGPSTPGVGWAAGVERMLLASPGTVEAVAPAVFVALDPGGDPGQAFRLARELREAGVSAQLEQARRSLKGQLKHADRLGARWVAIVGDATINLRDMHTGEQDEVDSRTVLARATAAPEP